MEYQGFLTKVLLPSGEPVEYKYDGVGRLTGRKDADGDTAFIQSGFEIIAARNNTSGEVVYSNPNSCNLGSGKSCFYLGDHLGNNILSSDENGNIITQYSYDAYGNADASQNPADTFDRRFAGKTGVYSDDKTGLNYMRLRWYSKPQMRFINSDILQDSNRFGYAVNNPISYIDPLGLAAVRSNPQRNDTIDSNVNYNNEHFMHAGESIQYVYQNHGMLAGDITNVAFHGGVFVLVAAGGIALAPAIVAYGSQFLTGPLFPPAMELAGGGGATILTSNAMNQLVTAGGTMTLGLLLLQALHHSWPVYLGGDRNQPLFEMDRYLHNKFHGFLDKLFARQKGTKKWQEILEILFKDDYKRKEFLRRFLRRNAKFETDPNNAGCEGLTRHALEQLIRQNLFPFLLFILGEVNYNEN